MVDFSSYGQEKLANHQAAYLKARQEAVCSCGSVYMLSGQHAKPCPCDLSNLLRRAEEIRKELES